MAWWLIRGVQGVTTHTRSQCHGDSHISITDSILRFLIPDQGKSNPIVSSHRIYHRQPAVQMQCSSLNMLRRLIQVEMKLIILFLASNQLQT